MNPLLENRFKRIENEIKEWYLSLKTCSNKFLEEGSRISNFLSNSTYNSAYNLNSNLNSNASSNSTCAPTLDKKNNISPDLNLNTTFDSRFAFEHTRSLNGGYTSPDWVSVQDLLNTFESEHGIRLNDCPELHNLLEEHDLIDPKVPFSRIPLLFEKFFQLVGTEDKDNIVKRAFTGRLAIPNWKEFCKEMREIYDTVSKNEGGYNATYIPQLAEVDSNLFGVALVTIDGQRFSIGDASHDFTIQSCSKIFTYCIACEDIGSEELHKHIGYEPSGKSFNAFTLDKNQKPHNPLINSGAITTCSLIRYTESATTRFNFIQKRFSEFSGGSRIAFDNATFLSERDTADRNFALAHYMKENSVFPKESKLSETLDLYFQSCSILVNCEKLAVMASTLANGGSCPTTNQKVVSPQIVKNILQLAFSCGMYDFSGEWSVSVGLPAKSGVSGAIAVVVPGVMGLSVFSPRLDKRGNSVRGVEFCVRSNKKFKWAIFDRLVKTGADEDPNEDMGEHDIDHISVLDDPMAYEKLLHMDSITQSCSQYGYGGANAGQNDSLCKDIPKDIVFDSSYQTEKDIADLKQTDQILNLMNYKTHSINFNNLATSNKESSNLQRIDEYLHQRDSNSKGTNKTYLLPNNQRYRNTSPFTSHYYKRPNQRQDSNSPFELQIGLNGNDIQNKSKSQNHIEANSIHMSPNSQNVIYKHSPIPRSTSPYDNWNRSDIIESNRIKSTVERDFSNISEEINTQIIQENQNFILPKNDTIIETDANNESTINIENGPPLKRARYI